MPWGYMRKALGYLIGLCALVIAWFLSKAVTRAVANWMAEGKDMSDVDQRIPAVLTGGLAGVAFLFGFLLIARKIVRSIAGPHP